MGRPVKEIKDPKDRIEELAGIGCTDAEIASICGISETNLALRFGPLLKEGRETFKSKIRGMQWKRALEGSDTMLVWLGKVVLGQKEQQSIILDATDTLAAFVNSIREAQTPSAGVKQVEGEEVSPGEPLQDT